MADKKRTFFYTENYGKYKPKMYFEQSSDRAKLCVI